MIETVIVIPVMILFFVGMLFFKNVYEQSLLAGNVSRAASVAFAMGACDGDPTSSALIQQYAGTQQMSNGQPVNVSALEGVTFGKAGNANPVAGLMTNNFRNGLVSQMTVQRSVGAQTGTQGTASFLGFHQNVGATAYTPCSDAIADGNYLVVVRAVEIDFPIQGPVP